MFTYRVHWEDGSDAGQAAYAQLIKPGETVWLSGAREVRVLDVVEIGEEEGSPYVGLLRVEPA